MIKADESQNALVVIAEPAQLRTIENIVRQLDQPRAQVLIHAAIVEISGDIAEAVGVQWSMSTGDAKGFINFPGTDIPIVGGLNFDEKKSAPEGAFLQLGGDRFGALISALASNTRQQPALHAEPVDPGQSGSGNHRRPERALQDRLLRHQQQRRGQSVHHRRTQGRGHQPEDQALHQRRFDVAAGGRAGGVGRRALGVGHRLLGPDHQQACTQEHHPGRRWRDHRDRRPDPRQRTHADEAGCRCCATFLTWARCFAGAGTPRPKAI